MLNQLPRNGGSLDGCTSTHYGKVGRYVLRSTILVSSALARIFPKHELGDHSKGQSDLSRTTLLSPTLNPLWAEQNSGQ